MRQSASASAARVSVQITSSGILMPASASVLQSTAVLTTTGTITTATATATSKLLAIQMASVSSISMPKSANASVILLLSLAKLMRSSIQISVCVFAHQNLAKLAWHGVLNTADASASLKSVHSHSISELILMTRLSVAASASLISAVRATTGMKKSVDVSALLPQEHTRAKKPFTGTALPANADAFR